MTGGKTSLASTPSDRCITEPTELARWQRDRLRPKCSVGTGSPGHLIGSAKENRHGRNGGARNEGYLACV